MSNFKCSKCGTINIDCGKEGYKTPREIELKKKVKELEKIINKLSKEVEAPYALDDLINIDKLEQKLKIAEEALIEQDNYFKEIENIINKYKLTESVIKVTSINPLDVQEILNIARKARGVK